MALDFERERERMVVEQLEARGIHDSAVLAAIRNVPRHRFVAPALCRRAYDDTPLPIGERQTISQPYMVALMTEAIGVHRVPISPPMRARFSARSATSTG